MGHAIFISYRRDDTEGEAGRLYDDLAREFGDSCVFMDVAGISPGIDFRKAIEDNVSSCGVLLAMIGPQWATIANPDGRRRLDDPNDFVSLEISSALRRNVPVIPVLVHDAKMPHPEQLPDALKDLAYRNSVELTHARWNSDTALLVTALRAYVTPAKATVDDPVHATVPVQLPAPHPAPEPAAAKGSKTPLLVVAGLAVLVVIAAVLYFWMKPAGERPIQDTTIEPAAAVTDAPKPAHLSTAAIEGKWTDLKQVHGNSLVELEITPSGKGLLMHAWGACKPQRCDWGAQPAQFDGATATATFNPSDNLPAGETRAAKVTVRADAGNLEVLVQNTFQGGASSHNSQARGTFVRGQ